MNSLPATPMTHPLLHLFPSESSAGSLRAGLSPGLDGHRIMALPELYAMGPLQDAEQRSEFWQRWLTGFPDAAEPGVDTARPFAAWDAFDSHLREQPQQHIVIWHTGSGEDQTFLRMACHRLAGSPLPMHEVSVPPFHGLHSLGMNPPHVLARHVARATPLSASRRRQLAAAFPTVAAAVGLRECSQEGVLELRAISCHDHEILAHCPREWWPAGRVCGNVMGHDDMRNPLSETFVAGRLAKLIDEGHIEARQRHAVWHETRVRRTG